MEDELESIIDNRDVPYTGHISRNVKDNYTYVTSTPAINSNYYTSSTSDGDSIINYIKDSYWKNYYCDQISTGESLTGDVFPYNVGNINISSKKKMDEYIKTLSGLFGVTEYYIPDKLESLGVGILNKVKETRKVINELLVSLKDANNKKDREVIQQTIQYHSGRLSVYSDFFNIINKIIEENK